MANTEHPYSLVTERDGVAYVSGTTTIDYATHLPVEGDRAALDAAPDKVERRLANVGLGLHAVTKVTYYLLDMRLRAVANAQFETRFAPPRPALPERRSVCAPFHTMGLRSRTSSRIDHYVSNVRLAPQAAISY